VSQQHVAVPPGQSASFELGVQNATSRQQRVQVHIALPAASGLSASPVNSRLALAPDGRVTLGVTLHASASAVSRFDWVTVTVTAPGGSPQTVELAVQLT
jgi:uncharacterized protein YfaS (alpha-2-macroglobulin family)